MQRIVFRLLCRSMICRRYVVLFVSFLMIPYWCLRAPVSGNGQVYTLPRSSLTMLWLGVLMQRCYEYVVWIYKAEDLIEVRVRWKQAS